VTVFIAPDLTEAGTVRQPPRLIAFSLGGRVVPNALINILTEVGNLNEPPCWAGCPATNNQGGQPAQPPRRPFGKRLVKVLV
jgi:hypothetical protein